VANPADAIAKIQDKWLAITGISNAPDEPPESANVFPFVATFDRSGTLRPRSYGWGQDVVTIYSELHMARTLLTAAISAAYGHKATFLQKLLSDPTLGGTVSTINEVRYTFGYLNWGEVKTVGYRFEIDVKVAVLAA